jgi:hypothetical protein
MCSLKKCPKCGIEKPLTKDFFRVESRRLGGFESRCKECKMTEKSIKLKNEKLSGRRVCSDCGIEKNFSDFEKPRYDIFSNGKSTTMSCCRECNNKRMKSNRLKNKSENYEYHSVREKLNGARKRAKNGNYMFDITIEDLMPFPLVCEVLGIKLDYNVYGNSRPDNTASLDKVIPDLGYIKGNVRIISHRANRLKSDLDFDTIERIKDYMIRNSKE